MSGRPAHYSKFNKREKGREITMEEPSFMFDVLLDPSGMRYFKTYLEKRDLDAYIFFYQEAQALLEIPDASFVRTAASRILRKVRLEKNIYACNC